MARGARDAHADAERSFEQLYRGHRGEVYRAALRELGNVHDAEDVTQAAFVDAYRAVLRGTRPQAPRAWLLTIAENVRRRRFRTSLLRPREEPLDADAAIAVEESREQASALLDALGSLTPEQRDAFLLREIAGLSYDEIAARTGSTVGSVQMLLFRARKALREELEPPQVRPLLVPLLTLFSRAEHLGAVPRAAGALGALAVAVGLGVGSSVPAQAESPLVREQATEARAVGADAPTRPTRAPVAVVAALPVTPTESPPLAAAPAPAPSRPVSPATETAEPARGSATPREQPVAALPVELSASLATSSPDVVLPDLVLPAPVPADSLLESAGAAGAAGADAPPLPELPLDALPPVP